MNSNIRSSFNGIDRHSRRGANVGSKLGRQARLDPAQQFADPQVVDTVPALAVGPVVQRHQIDSEADRWLMLPRFRWLRNSLATPARLSSSGPYRDKPRNRGTRSAWQCDKASSSQVSLCRDDIATCALSS